ncbi:hypothetical protein DSO57_1033921 [Entomophthora muscae]|uniref:Uncharacterized protein n=1 Tax=Entomophthora muscae TaxID=34485 RepID=A0ACC2REN6_9FUNG|nr:hypothetical protein DSO57_1033921 [Entomophthora muscae]
MDSTHSEYCQGLVDGCILINVVSGRLPGRVLPRQDVMAQLISPLDMATKLEIVARRRQGLKEIVGQAKSRMVAHAEVQALEAQLHDAGTPIRLSDKPRAIQLQTTFDLTNFRWLGKTRYFGDAPSRIQVVLLDDRVIVMTPKNEALLVWSCVQDLRAIPFNPRTSDPLGIVSMHSLISQAFP